MGYHRDPTGWTSRTPQRLVNRIREIRDAHTRRLTSPAPRTMMPNASDPLMTPREYNHRETGSEMPRRAIDDSRTTRRGRDGGAARVAKNCTSLYHTQCSEPIRDST